LQGYVSSFLLIGTYWLQHFAMRHYVKRVDRLFINLNGLFLLSVSFVPFPIGLQASYGYDQFAMALYASSQAACGFSLLAIWNYATKSSRVIDSTVSAKVIKSIQLRIWITPLASLVAIGVSFVNLELSQLLFLAIRIWYLSHRAVDRGWMEKTSASETDSQECNRWWAVSNAACLRKCSQQPMTRVVGAFSPLSGRDREVPIGSSGPARLIT
jgi:uncharacterized membrane protein